MCVHLIGADQIHCAESARVIKCHPCAIADIKYNVIMFLRGRVIMHKIAQRVTGYQHAARHAQMNQQRFTAVQICQDILGPSPQPVDPCSGQARRHIRRKGPAQIRAVNGGMCDALARHNGF